MSNVLRTFLERLSDIGHSDVLRTFVECYINVSNIVCPLGRCPPPILFVRTYVVVLEKLSDTYCFYVPKMVCRGQKPLPKSAVPNEFNGVENFEKIG